MLVDAEDVDTTRIVLRYLADDFASGTVGRRLGRMFREYGLTDITLIPRTCVLTDLETAEPYWTLRANAKRAVEAGLLTSARAESWIESLELGDRAGHFFNALTAFVVCGSKAS